MNNRNQYLPGYIIGTIVFTITVAGWLYAEAHGISTSALLGFAIPVVGALFLANGVTNLARDARAAATQTNGSLETRVEAAVTRALASRDQARTWQVVQQPPLPTESHDPQP